MGKLNKRSILVICLVFIALLILGSYLYVKYSIHHGEELRKNATQNASNQLVMPNSCEKRDWRSYKQSEVFGTSHVVEVTYSCLDQPLGNLIDLVKEGLAQANFDTVIDSSIEPDTTAYPGLQSVGKMLLKSSSDSPDKPMTLDIEFRDVDGNTLKADNKENIYKLPVNSIYITIHKI